MNGKEQKRYYKEFQNPGFIRELVLNGIKREYIEKIEEFAKELGKNFEPTQMYRIFNDLVKINDEVRRKDKKDIDLNDFHKRLLVLRPRIAYTFARIIDRSGKHDKEIIDTFRRFIINSIDIITDENSEKAIDYFKNFFDVYESILAYHKAAIVMKK